MVVVDRATALSFVLPRPNKSKKSGRDDTVLSLEKYAATPRTVVHHLALGVSASVVTTSEAKKRRPTERHIYDTESNGQLEHWVLAVSFGICFNPFLCYAVITSNTNTGFLERKGRKAIC